MKEDREIPMFFEYAPCEYCIEEVYIECEDFFILLWQYIDYIVTNCKECPKLKEVLEGKEMEFYGGLKVSINRKSRDDVEVRVRWEV